MNQTEEAPVSQNPMSQMKEAAAQAAVETITIDAERAHARMEQGDPVGAADAQDMGILSTRGTVVLSATGQRITAEDKQSRYLVDNPRNGERVLIAADPGRVMDIIHGNALVEADARATMNASPARRSRLGKFSLGHKR